MYEHICQGAECPACSPWGMTHLRYFQEDTSLRQRKIRAGWTDSTGAQVTQYPKRLGVGATVIILVGAMVLCQRRQDNAWWGFPGGSQNVGESILTCAIREAKEETGLSIILLGLTSVDSDPYMAGLCTYPDGVVHYTNLTFLARPLHILPSGQTPAVRCCAESLELRWVPLHRLPSPFMVSHQWRLEQAMAHTGPFLPVR